MLGPAVLNAKEGLAEIGSWSLRLLAKYATEERLIRIVGQDGEIEAKTFKGTELAGKPQPGVNYFDVEVQMASRLPLSQAARREMIIQLAQAPPV